MAASVPRDRSATTCKQPRFAAEVGRLSPSGADTTARAHHKTGRALHWRREGLGVAYLELLMYEGRRQAAARPGLGLRGLCARCALCGGRGDIALVADWRCARARSSSRRTLRGRSISAWSPVPEVPEATGAGVRRLGTRNRVRLGGGPPWPRDCEPCSVDGEVLGRDAAAAASLSAACREVVAEERNAPELPGRGYGARGVQSAGVLGRGENDTFWCTRYTWAASSRGTGELHLIQAGLSSFLGSTMATLTRGRTRGRTHAIGLPQGEAMTGSGWVAGLVLLPLEAVVGRGDASSRLAVGQLLVAVVGVLFVPSSECSRTRPRRRASSPLCSVFRARGVACWSRRPDLPLPVRYLDDTMKAWQDSSAHSLRRGLPRGTK